MQPPAIAKSEDFLPSLALIIGFSRPVAAGLATKLALGGAKVLLSATAAPHPGIPETTLDPKNPAAVIQLFEAADRHGPALDLVVFDASHPVRAGAAKTVIAQAASRMAPQRRGAIMIASRNPPDKSRRLWPPFRTPPMERLLTAASRALALHDIQVLGIDLTRRATNDNTLDDHLVLELLERAYPRTSPIAPLFPHPAVTDQLPNLCLI